MAISEFAESYLKNAQSEIYEAAEELMAVMGKYHGVFKVTIECKGVDEVKVIIASDYKKLDEHLRIYKNQTIHGKD